MRNPWQTTCIVLQLTVAKPATRPPGQALAELGDTLLDEKVPQAKAAQRRGDSSSPDPDLSPSPDPDLSPSPDPDLSPSPDPDLSTSPEPDLSPSPDPDLSPIPDLTPTLAYTPY